METAEQTHQRRHTDRLHKASVKQAETHEQTVHRQEYNKQCKKTSRAHETPEQMSNDNR